MLIFLTLTYLKNNVKGEAMGHRFSSHPVSDPIHAATNIVFTLHTLGENPDMPLDSIWICSTEVTSGLRLTTCDIRYNLYLRP